MISCQQMSQEEPVSFETMVVKKENRTLNTVISAKVEGRQDVSILPQVNGTIKEIAVREGQKIAIGQKLFLIDPRPYELAAQTAEANTAAAKAQLATAKLNYESNKDLFEKKIVSRYVLETAENNYNSAKADLALAEAQEANAKNDLSHCIVTSPVNGVVGNLPYRVGDLVNPSISVPLTVVSDNGTVMACFSINEELYTSIAGDIHTSRGTGVGLKELPDVQLQLKSGDIYESTGRIISISGMVDATTGSVTCKAEFPNPDGILTSGISANILYPTDYEDVVVIPQTATMQFQDKIMVYKVESDNTAKSAIITVSPINDGKEYIVLEGLNEGEEIITVGINKVQDGMPVKF